MYNGIWLMYAGSGHWNFTYLGLSVIICGLDKIEKKYIKDFNLFEI